MVSPAWLQYARSFEPSMEPSLDEAFLAEGSSHGRADLELHLGKGAWSDRLAHVVGDLNHKETSGTGEETGFLPSELAIHSTAELVALGTAASSIDSTRMSLDLLNSIHSWRLSLCASKFRDQPTLGVKNAPGILRLQTSEAKLNHSVLLRWA